MECTAPSVAILTWLIVGVMTHSPLVLGGESSSSVVDVRNGQLSVNHTQPCVQFEGEVEQFQTDVLVIQNNLTLCNMATTENQMLVFQLETSAPEASRDQPIVFVTRSDSNVQNWQFPLKIESLNDTFYSAERTICTSTDFSMVPGPVMYVNVFANSSTPVKYSLKATPISNFVLSLNGSVDVNVSVNGPQIRYFKYPSDVSSVTVEVNSSDPGCMIVSVQNVTCPVNDLLSNAQSKGVYQTMKTSASLSITAGKDITGSSFFLVLVIADFSTCWSKVPESGPEYNTTQIVTIKVEELLQGSKFKFPIAVMFFCFVALGMIMSTCMFCHLCCNCVPTILWTPRHTCRCFKCISFHWSNDNNTNVGIQENEPLVSGRNTVRYGAGNSSSESENDELVMSGKMRGLLAKVESDLSINDFLKPNTEELQHKYSVYGWNTITVGIFYGLPAFQLVLAEQLILNISGDQDICYYNFKCANPYGILSAFNNVWSNIGYFILGFFFMVIVGIRQYNLRRINKRKEDVGKGIPHFFGIYYAMGIALMTEGFMSAFYHICPTNANFQFDTAFMFVIGGLLIVKILQARHPSIHANAFIAFFSFAVVIFMTLLALWEANSAPMVSRVTVLFLVLFAVALFCLSFYFYHDWTLGHWIRKETYVHVCQWLSSCCTARVNGMKPRHLCRFVRLAAVISSNLVIGISLVVIQVDVASIILGLFVVNFIIFLATYVFFKLYYSEPFTLIPILSLILNGVCWLTAFYFYYQAVSDWTSTPAESRSHNHECVFMNFYDYHDVWHFFSASAMFFSFLFVLTLDDGLQFTPREKIHVF